MDYWTPGRFKHAKNLLAINTKEVKWNGEFLFVDMDPLHLLIAHNITF